jgi:hypothetical protein
MAYLNKKFKPTPAMALGSLVHHILLTPSIPVNTAFIELPDSLDKRTKAGKEQFLEIEVEAKASGKTIVTTKDIDTAEHITQKALNDFRVVQILEGCTNFEKEYLFDVDGLPFRSFIDADGDDVILEVKTSADASLPYITREFFNYKYHLQAGIYSTILPNRRFMYLVVETSVPYNITVVTASEAYLQHGRNEFARLRAKFKEAMNFNLFESGYEFYQKEATETLQLPSWVKTEEVYNG